VEVEQDGKTWLLRSPLKGCVGQAFKAVVVAVPPSAKEANPNARPFSEGENHPFTWESGKSTVQDEAK